ncbi:protease inhibitor I42 family protein [Kriegella aquimaris]|uniref:protease inhibitor I42 family protein n=1 Tax=Kriegella aquimaris TaxID=192904 RepID=UPI00159FBC00|nr:protease inhibitor I42 family protein [Kriegella aquimaris]
MEYTEKDSGKTIVLETVPFEFAVKLDENSTTGYLWEIAALPDHIKLVKKDLVLPKSRMAGATNSRIFEFSVKEKVAGRLGLNNCRPWDNNDIVDSFVLDFAIN